jgi:hypothetical protein
VKIRYRDFRGWREKELLLLEAVHVFLEFRQLGRADHTFAPNQKWRAHFQVAMLVRVQIEHELDERPLQSRAGAGKTDIPAAAQFRGALQSKSFSFVPSAT